MNLGSSASDDKESKGVAITNTKTPEIGDHWPIQKFHGTRRSLPPPGTMSGKILINGSSQLTCANETFGKSISTSAALLK
jgi:hypothetical protein